MSAQASRNLIAVLIVIVFLALLLVLGGCASYEAEIRPDGSGWVKIRSTREFPEGMKTSYKDFTFEANSVQGGLSMQDVVSLANFLVAKGIPLAPTPQEE